MKLLFIEDRTNSSKALNNRLKKEGYVVDTVHDGESGLEMALLGSYELIVLDSFLPIIKGLNFIKERIFERLWGSNSVIEFANVDLYICYLRKKIGAPTIKTVRNLGYYLEHTK